MCVCVCVCVCVIEKKVGFLGQDIFQRASSFKPCPLHANQLKQAEIKHELTSFVPVHFSSFKAVHCVFHEQVSGTGGNE